MSADQGAQPAAVEKTGYRGFGSFHVDVPVEELVAAACRPGYRPPANPCAPPAPPAPPVFGASMRSEFGIDFERWTFLNHGAFGGALRCAQQEAGTWRELCERQPLLFLDRQLFPQLVRVLAELAALLGASPADLALLPNATTGLNTVLASFRRRLGAGDGVLSLDLGYGSVKRMIQDLCQETGATWVEPQVGFPLPDGAALVRQVAEALSSAELAGARIRLAVFDAVTSNTAIVLPLRELVELCHSRGVEVLVDGAHAPGMLPVNLSELGADYWVGNCHKWLCAPRGSGCLWVHPRHRGRVRPLVTSHGAGAGFTSEFIWDGNRDYAPYLAISAALRFWSAVPGGLQAAWSYQRALLAQAAHLLAAAWGLLEQGCGSGSASDSSNNSTGATLVPLDMCGAMALVRLPPALAAAAAATAGAPSAAAPATGGAVPAATSADAKWVQDRLHFEHAIEAPVKCVGGQLYVRLSAAVYNELQDYQRLADAVLSML